LFQAILRKKTKHIEIDTTQKCCSMRIEKGRKDEGKKAIRQQMMLSTEKN